MAPDPRHFHRRSIRLKGIDYTQPGAYFVTICAHQREEIFGAVVDDEIRLSPLGIIVRDEWLRSAEIRKEICLFEDEFVVMPNHLHGIVWIIGNDPVGADGVRPDLPNNVRTGEPQSDGFPTIPKKGAIAPERGARGASLAPLQAPLQTPLNAPLRKAPRSLGSFVAGFKAAVTGRAGRELNSANLWQRNYYEHIIRSEAELRKIWNYIDTNPLHWQADQLHPSAPSGALDQESP